MPRSGSLTIAARGWMQHGEGLVRASTCYFQALQSLALVRQKARDAVGVEAGRVPVSQASLSSPDHLVEDAMSRLSRATPEISRGDVQKEARRVNASKCWCDVHHLVSTARCNITFNALPVMRRAQVPSHLLTCRPGNIRSKSNPCTVRQR